MTTSTPHTVLITGAASGIGRCFTQHYLSQPDTLVIAVDINSIDLQSQNLLKFKTDMSSTDSILSLVNDLGKDPGVHHFDLIIHSAGIRGLVPEVERQQPDNVAAAETLDVMNHATIMQTYQINTIGTFTLLQALHKSDMFRLPAGDPNRYTKVAIMTSRMGSISYNKVGGGYAYRASKAALNSIVKSMSLDVPYVVFALVHPGRVETGLTMCREEGAMGVEESVGDMLKLLEKLDIRDSGRFMDRFGADIGW